MTPGWAGLAVLLTVGAAFVTGLPRGWLLVAGRGRLYGLCGDRLALCRVPSPRVRADNSPLHLSAHAEGLRRRRHRAPEGRGGSRPPGLRCSPGFSRATSTARCCRADRILWSSLSLFALLYLLSPVSPHGAAWFPQLPPGLRTPCPVSRGSPTPRQPGSSLGVGAMVTDRHMRSGGHLWTHPASLGVDGLLALGYEYGEQVRQINGRLRSSGPSTTHLPIRPS